MLIPELTDAFVAKLSSDGVLLWNTFLGGNGARTDYYQAVKVDSAGNVYLTGFSYNWGTPVNAHAGAVDVFVAKLNSSGVLQWHTFMGSANSEDGPTLDIDASGNIYVAGSGNTTWGAPINPYSGGSDFFVAKLNTSGVKQWHTFLGSTGNDQVRAISVDNSGNIYVAGYCYETWGSPIQPIAGLGDGFVAKLNNSGLLQWNTFLGSATKSDSVSSIVADGDDSIYIAGESQATWGTPFNPFSGWKDAFAARLNSSGVLLWNTFLGQEYDDNCYSLTADDSGNVHIAGQSYGTWGTPVNAFNDWSDIFVAKIHDTDFDDTTAPEVDSESPLDGAANVPVDATITATFSEDIAPLTIDTNSFSLDNGVSGSVSYDSNRFTATFTPDTDLDFETTYTVTISTVVEDLAGNPLESEYAWSFTTAPVTATISGAPTILTHSSSATLTVGGTGVTAYKYRLDTGNFSGEISVGTPISLGGLSDGNHAVTVIGKDGDGNWQPEASPTTVLWTVGPPASLAAGLYFSAALKPDGTVWTWGRNFYGQLGDGVLVHEELAHTVIPTQVPGLCDMTAIATGWEFSLATKSDGTVWAWGRNDYSQLGDGTTTDRSTPSQISGVSNAVAVAAGEHHVLALKNDGTVWSWGGNSGGQLGDGTNTDRPAPTQIPGLNNVIAIAAGSHHSIALRSDGSIWTWGSNIYGELGNGTHDQKSDPIQILTLTDVRGIGAGTAHTLAIKSDGTAWAWGLNNYGQLGTNSTGSYTVPVPVQGISNVVSIRGGIEYSSIAHKADGTVWAWGNNHLANLGDGTTTTRLLPVQVSGPTDSVAAVGGGYHGLSLESDGTLGAWGWNAHGQVGDGTTVTRMVSVATQLDLSTLTATISGVPPNFTNSTDATLTVAGSGVVSYKYKLDAGSYSNEIAIGSSISLTSLAEGSHSVSVIGKNSCGQWQQESDATTVSWTIDLTASVATLSGTPASPTSSTSALVTVAGADIVAYKYQLDGGSYSPELAVGTPISLSSLAEGQHTVSAVGKDSAGNWQDTGSATSVSWTIDTTASMATLSGTPVSPTSSTAAVLTVAGTDIVAYKYQQDGGSYSSEIAVAAPISLSGLAEGLHTVAVIGKDTAGNWQDLGIATTVSWTIDTTPPIATISGTPSNPTNATTASLTVSGTGVVSYKYAIDGGSYSSEIASAAPISLSGLAEGLRAVAVIGKDAAGNWQDVANAATASWTVDTTAPAANISGVPADPSNTATASLTVAGAGVVSYRYSLDGGAYASEVAIGTPISLSGLVEGPHTVSVVGKDNAGNWQPDIAATTAAWTIDTTSPTGVSVVNEGDEYANATSVSISLSSNDAQQVCFSNDGANYSNWEAMTDTKSWVLSEGEGEKTVYIKYKDVAGNTCVATDSITLDTVPPDAPVPNPADDLFENIPTLDWEVSAGCAGYILEYDTDVNFSTATRIEDILPSDYTPDSMLSDGTWYWRVQAVDAAGNMSGWSTTEELSINTSSYCNDDPQKPQLLLPADGDLNVSRTPVLTTSAFLEPNHCSLHWKTRWQISERADFHGLTLNANTFENLNRYEVTKSVLKPNTTYYWRVRYWGTYGNKSEWSEIFSFTTQAAIEDVDDNGIVDDEEVDPGVDLDDDGTDDRNQATEIKSVKTCRGELMVGVRPISGNIVRIDAVDDLTLEETEGKPQKIPYGMIAYRIELAQYGQTVTVDIHLSKPAPPNAYWVMFDPVNGWYDYSAHAVFNPSRSKVSIQLKDGGFGDCDHTENGVIVDPGGLAIADENSGGGGCFVSTINPGHDFIGLPGWVVGLGILLLSLAIIFHHRLTTRRICDLIL